MQNHTMNLMIVTYITTYYCGAWADTMGNSFLFDQTWQIEVKKMGVGCSEKKKNFNTFLNVMNDKTEYNPQRDMNAWAI